MGTIYPSLVTIPIKKKKGSLIPYLYPGKTRLRTVVIGDTFLSNTIPYDFT